MSENVNCESWRVVGNANFDSVLPSKRRDGRVAEGGGLLNRYTVKSRIGGSNPPLSAMPGVVKFPFFGRHEKRKLASRSLASEGRKRRIG